MGIIGIGVGLPFKLERYLTPNKVSSSLLWIKEDTDVSGVREGTVYERNCLEGDGSAYIQFNSFFKLNRKFNESHAFSDVPSGVFTLVNVPINNNAIVISSSETGGTTYIENTDYSVNYTTGEVTNLDVGIAQGQTVYVDYVYEDVASFYYQTTDGSYTEASTDSDIKWTIPLGEKVANIMIKGSVYKCNEGSGDALLDNTGLYGARISDDTIWSTNNLLDDTINRLGFYLSNVWYDYGQNMVSNSNFNNDTWTGTAPARTPFGWQIIGTPDSTNYFESEDITVTQNMIDAGLEGYSLNQTVSTLRMVSNGTSGEIRSIGFKLKDGIKYVITFDILKVTSGKIKIVTNPSYEVIQNQIGSIGNKKYTHTVASGGTYYFTILKDSTPLDINITNVKVYERLNNGVLIPIIGNTNEVAATDEDQNIQETEVVGSVKFTPTTTETTIELPVCADLKQVDSQIGDEFFTGDTPNTVSFSSFEQNYANENIAFGNANRKELAFFNEKLTRAGYKYQEKTTLDDCSSSTPWDDLSNATVSEVSDGIEITSTSAGATSYAQRALSILKENWDIIGMEYYVEDPSQFDYIYFKIISNSLGERIARHNVSGQVKKGWNYLITEKTEYYNGSGDIDIDEIRVEFDAKAGETPSIIIREVLRDQESNNKLLLTFDGLYEGIYNIAYPYLKGLNLTGTIYLAHHHLGLPGYMTLEQLKELSDAGWTVGVRNYTGSTDYGNLTLEERKADIQLAIDFLLDNGFPRPRHFAIPKPWSNFNDQLEENTQMWKDLGFLTARNTYAYNEYYPIRNCYNLNAVAGSTYIVTMKDYIDKMRKSQTNLVLYLHDVLEGATGVKSETSDFYEIVKYAKSFNIDMPNMSDWYNDLYKNTLDPTLKYFKPFSTQDEWTPSEITTALWLDADDTDTLTLDGSNVTIWEDKSGAGFDASQTNSTLKPIYDSVNKRVQFVDDTLLLTTGSSIARNVAGFNCFAVVQYTNQTLGQSIFVATRGDSNSSARFALGFNIVGSGLLVGGRRLDTDSYQSVSNGTTSVSKIIQHGEIDYSNSNAYSYINGNLDASSLTFQTDGNTQDNDSLNVRIGNINTENFQFTGYIHELVIVNDNVTEDTRQKMEGYLAHKWGLESELPTLHPYKTESPKV